MNLGFIILAHHQPDAIRRLTDILTTDGNRVVIHFDSSAASGDQRAVRLIAEEKPDQITVISKVHCVWGEWSLVEAVLLALREFAGMSDPPDYIHLMSGADFPLRPIAQVKEFLRLNPGVDFIESCDISKNSWVKGGLGQGTLPLLLSLQLPNPPKGVQLYGPLAAETEHPEANAARPETPHGIAVVDFALVHL